jgi:hypothetical protein
MRISAGIKKILGSVRDENVFVDAEAKGTFLGTSAYPKISVHPQLRFLQHPSIPKN